MMMRYHTIGAYIMQIEKLRKIIPLNPLRFAKASMQF